MLWLNSNNNDNHNHPRRLKKDNKKMFCIERPVRIGNIFAIPSTCTDTTNTHFCLIIIFTLQNSSAAILDQYFPIT